MFALSDEQEMLVTTLRDIAEAEFAANAFEWHGDTPWENIELLANRGYLGVNISEEYGGAGMSEFDAMLSIEVVGQMCPDTAEYLYNQQMVAPRAIEMFGSEVVKQRYLPKVVGGEAAIAIAISEPESGSDVGSMQTMAETDRDEIVVTGEKIWVSNVRSATAAVVWVKFDDGLGSLVMDLDSEGVEITEHYKNMADHEQTQFHMNDVRVPKENVLTSGADGFKQQLRALNWERLGSATLANAYARTALDRALEYSADRSQFGQPIGDFQGIEWKLADMVKRLEASRALTYRAAIRANEQDRIPGRLDASVAKLFASEMVERVVSEALQIHGANGYQRGHPLEYLYRLARGRRLAAGTDEIQKNQIADVLKSDGIPEIG